jgi:hypothetical protein
MTAVGTLNKMRKGIPEGMKEVTGRPPGDYQILYQEGGKLSLHSWIVKSKSKSKKGKTSLLNLPYFSKSCSTKTPNNCKVTLLNRRILRAEFRIHLDL